MEHVKNIVQNLSYFRNALENEPVEDYIEELDLRVDCPGHTLCLSTKGEDCGSDSLTDNQLSEKDKTKLLKLHNDYRSKYASGSYGFPKAANMMKLRLVQIGARAPLLGDTRLRENKTQILRSAPYFRAGTCFYAASSKLLVQVLRSCLPATA